MPSLSTLPPDLIEMILDELGDYFFKHAAASKSINSLAQVSRSLYLPAKRRFMKRIRLREESEKDLFLSLLTKKPLLGGLVKSLTVYFHPCESSRPDPVDYLVNLLSLLPNLQSFSLILDDDDDETVLTGLDKVGRQLPLLSSITTLDISFSLHQKEDIIDYFVKASPNLKELDIAVVGLDGNEDVNNLSTFLITTSGFPFHSFTWKTQLGVFSEPKFTALESHYERTLLSRFKPSCFSRLNEFCSEVTFNESILPVLESSASTLESLTLIRIDSSLYPSLVSALPTLIRLNYFRIIQQHPSHPKLYNSIFSYIPPSLKKMHVRLNLSHLKYLQNHPRPDLKLHTIRMEGNEVGIFDHLPATVVKVIGGEMEIEEVYNKLLSQREHRSNKLEFITSEYWELAPKERKVWIEKFKRLGITFLS